jgi:hypothetical protein
MHRRRHFRRQKPDKFLNSLTPQSSDLNSHFTQCANSTSFNLISSKCVLILSSPSTTILHSKCSLSFTLHQHPVCISLHYHTFHMPNPAHPPRYVDPNNVWRKFKPRSFSLRSFLQLPITSSIFGPH